MYTILCLEVKEGLAGGVYGWPGSREWWGSWLMEGLVGVWGSRMVGTKGIVGV